MDKAHPRFGLTTLSVLFHVVLGFVCTADGADPSPKGPFEPLKQHATVPEAEALWTKVVAAEQSVREHIERFAKAKAIEPKQLTQALSAHDDMRTWDLRLQAMGEPVAVDFELRRAFYQARLVEAYNAWLSQPNSAPVRQKAIAQLTKTQQKRMKDLDAIAAALGNGDLQEAETKTDAFKEDLYRLTNILSLDERKPFTEAFETVRSRVESAANADRVSTATAVFKETIDANEMEIQDTLRRIDIAIEGLSRSAQCSWDGNAIDGPTLLNHVSNAYKIAHTKLQSSAMLHRLQNRGIGGSYSIGFSASADDPWSAKSRDLTQAFLDRIAKLIKAESQSVPDDKAKEHYFAMLTTLADIDDRLDQNDWTNATQKGLAELTRKANLSLQVADYDSATSELLYWKEQFASAQAKKIDSHVPLPTICKERLSSSPQQLIGLYSYQPDDPGRPRLLSAIPDLVPLVAKSMGNAKIVANGIRKLDSSKPTWMSQFQAGLYCMMTDNVTLPQQVARLEKELLVDASNPALTLRATTALHSARNGSYISVGCTLQDFVLESPVSRFATFPVPASPLVPLGTVHPQGTQSELTFLLIRFVAKPDWFHHRYFVSRGDAAAITTDQRPLSSN
ncbi:MAG: hypothetical protein MUC43_06895 [Pirellula sp.]|jgi:hypothetical protein|nr:hypothetical protein [Pirellula sp.]